ncbi:MAG: glycosyltransferase family 4 protein [Armatimonadota bacterium]|nr:glycosyltransferase family 4 protein [Armatimonadota bacterium]
MSGGLRLAFVTQLVDPDDPILGFTVTWIRALAKRSQHLVAIANEVRRVPSDLGAEVVSLGKEQGAGRVRRGLRYLASLEATHRRYRPHALLAHMCPQYLVLAAPLLQLHRTPGVLWFAHPRDSALLRRAERAAAAVLTSLPGAFPFPSPKLLKVGQGIDVSRFTCVPPAPGGEVLRLLALGRLSPAKGLDTIIKGVSKARDAGVPVVLRIVGPATTPAEEAYARTVVRLAAGSGGAVSVEPAVLPVAIPDLFAEVDLLVNGMRAGSGDKVVFEAMAAGRPVVYSNPCFDPLTEGLSLRLRYREDDAADLAERLRELWEAGPDLRAEVGGALAERVNEAHGLDGWADRVIRVLAEVGRSA